MADDFYDLPRHSTLRNYIIPGLTSHLIGDWSDPKKERLRLFEMEAQQLVHIVPHSHRYDFHCRVIAGTVINTIWYPVKAASDSGPLLAKSRLTYNGAPGAYIKKFHSLDSYVPANTVYTQGAEYSMWHDEIHSIVFGYGAEVLFWEGPQLTDETYVLEPHVPGYGVVPLLKTEAWMFVKDNSNG